MNNAMTFKVVTQPDTWNDDAIEHELFVLVINGNTPEEKYIGTFGSVDTAKDYAQKYKIAYVAETFTIL